MLKSMLMRTSQKLGLGLVFSLVLLTIAFTIVRTVFAASTHESNPEEHIVFGIMEPQIAVMANAATPASHARLVKPIPPRFEEPITVSPTLGRTLDAPNEMRLGCILILSRS